MLSETFSADTFPNVSQFCQTGNIVSVSKTCFCRETETFFASGNSVSRVAKRGNSGETCLRIKCFLIFHSSKNSYSSIAFTVDITALLIHKHFYLRDSSFLRMLKWRKQRESSWMSPYQVWNKSQVSLISPSRMLVLMLLCANVSTVTNTGRKRDQRECSTCLGKNIGLSNRPSSDVSKLTITRTNGLLSFLVRHPVGVGVGGGGVHADATFSYDTLLTL